MFSDDELRLDCGTCLAANTTACSDCIVAHVLANDDGPIDLEPVPVTPVSMVDERDDVAQIVECFVRAGLADDPPTFVAVSEFEHAAPCELAGAHRGLR